MHIFILESHISHLRTKSEQELNRVLSMVVDFDNMRIAMNREENLETRKPYSYLLKVNIFFVNFFVKWNLI